MHRRNPEVGILVRREPSADAGRRGSVVQAGAGHLSDVIYRRMIRDLTAADRASVPAQPILAA